MRFKTHIVAIFIIITSLLCGQTEVFTIAKVMPEFPGGVKELANYLSMNVQYPAEAREAGISGKSYVNFIVDTTGKVTASKIIKSAGHKSLDDEAIRVVNSMPNWTPGRDSIRLVNVSMNLPINFKSLGEKRESSNEKKLSPEQQTKHDKSMSLYYEGHKLEQQYKFELALEKYNNSLKEEPENVYSMFDKGKMLMVLGKSTEACELWNKMIEMDLKKEASTEFVNSYCNKENGPELMATFLDQKKANDFFDNGMKDVRNGRYEAALSKFDSCLVYRPLNKDALFNKGLMHSKLDQKSKACSTWKKLLEISPEDKELEGIIKKNCN